MHKRMSEKDKHIYPDAKFDKTVPGYGKMRPDAYFPNVDEESVIFDIGGASKMSDIGKYEGLADIVEPIIC